MNALRAEAEILREQGYSYNMITEALGVAKGTLSYWFHDQPYTPNSEAKSRVDGSGAKGGLIKHAKKTLETERAINEAVAEIGSLSSRDLWMVGLGLYIGEGAKTNDCVRICNSDPAVIRIAVRWLEEVCGVPKSNIAIRLHLYPDNNEEDSINYWQKVTGLPLKNFSKTSIDRRTNKSKKAAGKLQHGTAHLRVMANGDKSKGVVLFRRVKGWMHGALNQV